MCGGYSNSTAGWSEGQAAARECVGLAWLWAKDTLTHQWLSGSTRAVGRQAPAATTSCLLCAVTMLPCLQTLPLSVRQQGADNERQTWCHIEYGPNAKWTRVGSIFNGGTYPVSHNLDPP